MFVLINIGFKLNFVNFTCGDFAIFAHHQVGSEDRVIEQSDALSLGLSRLSVERSYRNEKEVILRILKIYISRRIIAIIKENTVHQYSVSNNLKTFTYTN